MKIEKDFTSTSVALWTKVELFEKAANALQHTVVCYQQKNEGIIVRVKDTNGSVQKVMITRGSTVESLCKKAGMTSSTLTHAYS